MSERQKTLRKPYSGYYRYSGGPDLELTQVGPDTPGGEYLRRFWHPIELSSEVKDRPLAIRILGEDLVLFRDLSGKVALLDRHCSHRGASLEFGRITDRGIQCCYHGWHFGGDGGLLETPVDLGTTICGRLFHPAYPVREVAGLVFTYMGPPDEMPDFPNFDFLEESAEEQLFYKRHSPCNWIQTRDNELDNAHGYFLHTVMAGVQLTRAHQELAKIDAVESPLGVLTIQSRRVDGNLFVRVNSMTLPNVSRIACIEDGEGETAFDRRGPIIQWSVPVDDVNCFVIGWNTVAANLPDAKRNAFMDREVRAGRDIRSHPQLNFVFGQDGSRPYEERQLVPGDWDAWVGQGPIHVHAHDHLVPHDRAIVMYHRMLREGIQAVRAGSDPKGLVRRANGPIETYASNTSVPVPREASPDQDQQALLAFERDIIARTLDGTYRQDYRYERRPDRETPSTRMQLRREGIRGS